MITAFLFEQKTRFCFLNIDRTTKNNILKGAFLSLRILTLNYMYYAGRD